MLTKFPESAMRKSQKTWMSVVSTFGIQPSSTRSVFYVGADTIAYLSGFNVIFQNLADSALVAVLSLGEGLSAVPSIMFTPDFGTLVVCEERRDRSCVSFYDKTAQFTYSFRHRLQVSDKPGASLLHADIVTPTRVVVFSGAPEYSMLVFDNTSRSIVPSYSLTIAHDNILADSASASTGLRTTFNRISVLKFNDKELLVVSGPAIRAVKLGDSSVKVLPPSGLNLLPGKRHFTDILYLNRALSARFPTIPLDSDRLLLLATLEGTIVFMYNNTVVSEYRCRLFKDLPINALLFVNDPGFTAGQKADAPAGPAPKGLLDSVRQGSQSSNSVKLFDGIAAGVRESRKACGYLFTFCYTGVVHCYGILFSAMCDFVTHVVYGNSSRIEGKIDLGSVFCHQLAYSASAVLDHALARINATFSFDTVCMPASERGFVALATSESFKALFCIKTLHILKRVQENEAQRLFDLRNGGPGRLDGPGGRAGAATAAPSDALAEADMLMGEITDLTELSVSVDRLRFLNQDGAEGLSNFLGDPYSSTATNELYLLRPTMTTGNVVSLATACATDDVAIITSDRVVRIFGGQRLLEKSFTRLSEVLGYTVFHPSGNFLLISSSEYIILAVVYADRVEKVHQFPVPFCKAMCFLNSGDLFAAASGSHLFVYDFHTRAELAKVTEFSSRIVSVQPVVKDLAPMRYASDVFVCCADGSMCRYDLFGLTKVSAAFMRSAHIVATASLSATYYVSDELAASSGAGVMTIVGRTGEGALFSGTSALPATPVMVVVTSEGALRLADANMTEVTRYAGVLNPQDPAAQRDPSGDAQLAAVTRGRPVCVCNVYNALVVGYEFGYVGIRGIAPIMDFADPAEAAPTREVVIPISSSAITAVVPLSTNNGFLCSTNSGLVYSVLLARGMPARSAVVHRVSIPTLTAPAEERRPGAAGAQGALGTAGAAGVAPGTALGATAAAPTAGARRFGHNPANVARGAGPAAASAATAASIAPTTALSIAGHRLAPVLVRRAALAAVFARIAAARGAIVQTKARLDEQVGAREAEFAKDVNALHGRTAEEVSGYLSEYSRVETDHDTKSILLKRQIASNENTFRDSLAALQEQYQKRLVATNDGLALLSGQKLQFARDSERLVADFQAETERLVGELTALREGEAARLGGIVAQIQGEIDGRKSADDALFRLSEEELYAESAGLTNAFERRVQAACAAYAEVERYNRGVKGRYGELENRLLDQKRVLLAKEREIGDLRALIASQRKDVGNIRQEVENRDETIANRERRVFELRKRIRELVKVRFVLEYKIKEYSRQVEPRDQELSSLKTHLAEMNRELADYRTSLLQLKSNQTDQERRNASLRVQIADLGARRDATVTRMHGVRDYVNEIGRLAYYFSFGVANVQADYPPALLAYVDAHGGFRALGELGYGGAGSRLLREQSAAQAAQALQVGAAGTLPGALPALQPKGTARGSSAGHGPALPAPAPAPAPGSASGSGSGLAVSGAGAGAAGRRAAQQLTEENKRFRLLAKSIKNAYLALTQRENRYVEQKTRRAEEGNFANLEKTIVNMERKLSSNRVSTKSSTSTVVTQNAMLLQEINHLRRELHIAQVNSNAESKIDPRLLDEYEARKREIAKLRALIRKLEAGSVLGGAFLPDVDR